MSDYDPWVIELPDEWKAPERTLEPLLELDSVSWVRLLQFVSAALAEAGNDESVLIAFRDQMTDIDADYGRKVRVSMAFMGEMELEHDSPTFV